MRLRALLILSLCLLPLSLRAQLEPPKELPNAIPQGFGTRAGSFQSGEGVPIDTLDIDDGRLLLVLKDDHTWYYIKNYEKLASDTVFTEAWNSSATDPYHVKLEDLQLRNTICLVDSASVFVSPNQTKVFSKFGYRHGRQHQGVDLPLKTGTPVYAAFDGRVRVSEYHRGYGNLIILRHENGLETFYAHLSKMEAQRDDWVEAGQEIGLAGATGRASGSHLHYEVRYLGYAIDPEWIIDFSNGDLRHQVFTFKKQHLDPNFKYEPESDDEEELIALADEEDRLEAERLEAERKAAQYYTVKSGDTLSRIAVRYHTTINAICKLNNISAKSTLRVGQRLRVK